MVEAAPGVPASLCLCRASRYSAQAGRSRETLEKALAAPGPGPGELRFQVLRLLAGLAADQGRGDQARERFEQALALEPEHAGLRAEYADLLLQAGQPGEAAALAAGREASTRLLLRAALAARALGQDDDLLRERRLAGRFAAARAAGEDRWLEEEARFALELRGNPAGALWLAEASWELRRSPPAARVLLEAARRAGRPDAARPVLDWVAGAGVRLPWLAALVEGWEAPR